MAPESMPETETEPAPEPEPEPGHVVVDPETPQPSLPFTVGFAGEHGLSCDPTWEVTIYDTRGPEDLDWQGARIVARETGDWPVDATFTVHRDNDDFLAVVGLSCSPFTYYTQYFEIQTPQPLGGEGEDWDGDGIPDDIDPCPNDAWNDFDYDGVCGNIDLCPNHSPDDIDGNGQCGDQRGEDPCDGLPVDFNAAEDYLPCCFLPADGGDVEFNPIDPCCSFALIGGGLEELDAGAAFDPCCFMPTGESSDVQFNPIDPCCAVVESIGDVEVTDHLGFCGPCPLIGDSDHDGVCDPFDVEVCDGVDNNGDGLVDEGGVCITTTTSTTSSTSTSTTTTTTTGTTTTTSTTTSPPVTGSGRCASAHAQFETLPNVANADRDAWRFSAAAGDSVRVCVDTIDQATAVDLDLDGIRNGFNGASFTGANHLQTGGDDDVPCTYAPPNNFGCPDVTVTLATDDGDNLFFVDVDRWNWGTENYEGHYIISVFVNGAAVPLTLVGDDI